FLRGRCRYCGSRVSPLYPGLEIAAGGIALWASFLLDGWLFWASCGLGWALLALAATDLRNFILPDVLTLPLIPAGAAVAYAIDDSRIADHLIGAGAGFAALYGVAWLYERLRKRAGLGLGDAKLFSAAGAWLGWAGLPSVLLIGALIALLAVVIARMAGRSMSATDAIPFGTFLAIGFWIVWLYGPLTL
ncbi:MAG: A24 family peptidase, partial [Pirellulales bacterium]|nr:A24 family peptidase [Pirellulales bacterium]